MAISQHQYQPVWHNMRQGVAEGTRTFTDAIKEKKRLNEEQRQFDIGQKLQEEKFATDKAQWNQTFQETKRQYDQGYDVTKKQLKLQQDNALRNQEIHANNMEAHAFNKKRRDANLAVGKKIASFSKKMGDEETLYRNELERMGVLEGTFRDAYTTGPLSDVNTILGLFGSGVESREEAAKRKSGYSTAWERHSPDIIGEHGDVLGFDALRYTQQYLPKQLGETYQMDAYYPNYGNMNPLMQGMSNQFGGNY